MAELYREHGREECIIPVEGVYSLTKEGLFEHNIDKQTGQEYLVLFESEKYPFADEGSVLEDLILRRSPEDEDKLLLPEQYRTMGQVLNDTIGNVPTRHSLDLATKIFETLGSKLSLLAEYDGILPENISYKQIIIGLGSDGFNIKLLPPLTLQKAEDDEIYSLKNISMMLSTQLYSSCYNGASNRSQQEWLPTIFKRFVENFKLDF